MKWVLWIVVSLLHMGCSSDNDHFNRGYVISQSQVDAEAETAPSE